MAWGVFIRAQAVQNHRHKSYVHPPSNQGSQGNTLKMMSIHRLNVLLAMVLVIAIVLPQMANGQSDVYQYGQKRTSITTKYCGKHLSNALQLLCNGVYNSMFKKSGQEMEMDDYPYNYDEAYPLRSRASTNAMMGRFAGVRFRRQSRGVHDECCVKSCSVSELTSYCGR
ncbi:LIRP [Cephus cinctus]|uniref:LIRP n=1 Tax=Cephus cinctus TaxID=211228 RepID=A0AAJ7FEU0_CEPCN|nr:LIRP [Cephus cinctus]